jgi:adenosylmethionine-8-amino-7-oxononanoate aminotransferase
MQAGRLPECSSLKLGGQGATPGVSLPPDNAKKETVMTTSKRLVVHRRWGSEIPVIDHAEGVYLYDTTGKRYIDGCGGSSVVINLGHGTREVIDALYQQSLKVAFSPAHVFANAPAEQLGEMVAAIAPGDMKDNCRVWFTCTGTDAIDDAMRLARQYAVVNDQASRSLVIARWRGFHGNNIAVSGLHGHTFRRTIFMPMYVNQPHIPPAYCYRCPFEKTYPSCDLLCARYLETEIRQQGAENVLAFIAEPVVGAALGGVPAPEGYFQIIREICSRYGVMFIADEVMTAWGRTGTNWGVEHWGVTPDIIATAKGISSGYTPLAAVIAREDIWESLEEHNSPFRAGHTYNANPASCAAGVAVLTYLQKHDLVARSKEMGDYFLQQLRTLLRHDIIGDVRGLGLMLGFEIVKDKQTKQPFLPSQQMSSKLELEALKRGLVVYSCTGSVDGVAGDMVLLAPPFVITKEQIDECVSILHETITAMEKELA